MYQSPLLEHFCKCFLLAFVLMGLITAAGASSDSPPAYRLPLLKAHGVIHIAFWCFFILLHVMFMIYKKWILCDPFVPPHSKGYRLYMAAHHILGLIDVTAICLAIGANSQYSASLIVSDTPTYRSPTHKTAGIIILAFIFVQEIAPVLFGRFENPKYNYWAKLFHRYVGRILLLWIWFYQIWSGIELWQHNGIDLNDNVFTGVYVWIGSCALFITCMIIRGYYNQREKLKRLALKYSSVHSTSVTGEKPPLFDKKHDRMMSLSLDELAKHNREDDVWIAVNGFVLNCTDFRLEHPAGSGVMMKYAGKDASAAWNLNHERNFISKYASQLVVGVLEGTDPAIINELQLNTAIDVGALSRRSKFDGPRVIVIGGGLAGLSAVHSALQHGARVLLLDKMPLCGGNSVKATSGINGAGTRIQAALGIDDDWKKFCKDTYKSAANGASDAKSYALAEVLTSESAAAVHWLIDHFSLNLCEVGQLAAHSVARTHRGATKFPGKMITMKLLDDLKFISQDGSGTVEIINKAKVTKLIEKVDSSGQRRITGVVYEAPDGTHEEDNGVVIIATGGWAADYTSESLLGRFRPELLVLPTTNGEHCTGDGIKLAESIGAGCVGLDWVQVHPTGIVDPADPQAKVKTLAAEALRGADGLILNKHGKRFCNELGRRDYITGEMNKSSPPFYLILNSSGCHEMAWHVTHYESMGIMKKIMHGNELAEFIGIQPKELKETFQLYQSHAAYAFAEDDEYESKESALPTVVNDPNSLWSDVIRPIKDPYGKTIFKYGKAWTMDSSFYVAIITPALHYCMGGIKINDRAQVCRGPPESSDYLTPSTVHISGLYACGEVTGGVHGLNRLGGSSLLDCVCFGRIAGTNAAAELENWIGKVAMIGVETIDTSDPDIIVERERQRLRIKLKHHGADGIHTPTVISSTMAPLSLDQPLSVTPAA